MSSTSFMPPQVKQSMGHPNPAEAVHRQILKDIIGRVDSHDYPAGIELFRQDGSPCEIYLLEGGLAKLTRHEENGRELILDIRFAGSLLGSAAAIQQTPHPFAAVTATTCTLARLPAERFLALLMNDAGVGLSIYHLLSSEILNQAARMSEIACLPARQRLEQLLWQIGESVDGGRSEKSRFQLPLKYWEAARLLAITPTYLSRLLAELESEAIISRKNGWISVRKLASLWHRVDANSS